ncbi:putative trichome birefringence-like family [Helianthus annuus]|nr:putative trichome birefringence-like family [Helianthus annuus]KAJ0469183.1 putative trichome birefringence-like family [Helianthus annuus]KAJ0571092.1 putative trichome birefringence-like family [Helianthus annuus]KAJ0656723.1 putative trichome birefringence-like family [Helianthus annuus]KAJ0660328.1 putative trichome birefringence-like family [Helianthus annuus]
MRIRPLFFRLVIFLKGLIGVIMAMLLLLKFIRGCYFQESEDVKMNMSIETAYQKSVDTVLNWISKEVDTNIT